MRNKHLFISSLRNGNQNKTIKQIINKSSKKRSEITFVCGWMKTNLEKNKLGMIWRRNINVIYKMKCHLLALGRRRHLQFQWSSQSFTHSHTVASWENLLNVKTHRVESKKWSPQLATFHWNCRRLLVKCCRTCGASECRFGRLSQFRGNKYPKFLDEPHQWPSVHVSGEIGCIEIRIRHSECISLNRKSHDK